MSTDYSSLVCTEIWRDVPQFVGLYQVSTWGSVKALARTFIDAMGRRVFRKERLLSLKPNSTGYVLICLCKGEKKFFKFVHRLVLETFVASCPNGKEACHKDGNRTNNRVDNLRWDTRTNNHKDKQLHGTDLSGTRNPKAKTTKEEVVELRNLHATRKYSYKKLAKLFNMPVSRVNSIVNFNTWRRMDDKLSSLLLKEEHHGNRQKNLSQIG